MHDLLWNLAATASRDVRLEDQPHYFMVVVVHDGTLRGCVEVLRDMPASERREIYIEMVDEPFRRFDAPEIDGLISGILV